MKKLFQKTLAILMSVLITAASVYIPALAENAESDLVIADFSNPATFNADGIFVENTVLNDDTDYTYSGAAYSAKINLDTNTSTYKTSFYSLQSAGIPTDWSDYELINIRYYASGSASFAMVLAEAARRGGGNEAVNGYYYTMLKPEVTPGWSTASVKLSDFIANNQSPTLTLANINYLQICTDDKGKTGYQGYTDGDMLFIDSIWLSHSDDIDPEPEPKPDPEPEPEPEPEENGPEPQNQAVVANFRDSAVTNAFAGRLSDNTDPAYTYAYAKSSAKFTMSSGKSTAITDISPFAFSTDWSDYEYFCIRFYASKSGVTFAPNILKSNGRGVSAATENPWLFHLITTQHIGWHTVTLRLSEFTKWTQADITWSDANYLQIMIDDTSKGVSGAVDAELYFDKIWLTNDPVEEPEITGAYPENGSVSVPALSPSVRFAVNYMLYKIIDSSDVKITSEAGESITPEITFSGNEINIKAPGALTPGQIYSISGDITFLDINDQLAVETLDYTFTTSANTLSVSEPWFTVEGKEITEPVSDGNVCVKVMCKNTAGEPSEAYLCTALYDTDGKIVTIASMEILLSAGETAEAELSIEVTADGILKAWICDKAGIPLSGSYSQLGGKVPFNAFEYTENSYTAQAESDIDKINVFGESDGCFDFFLADIRNSDGESVYTVPFYPESDGSFNVGMYLAETIATDTYSVYTSRFATNHKFAGEVKYISETDRNSLLNTANTGNYKSIEAELDKIRNEFGFDINDVKTAALALYENKPYSSYRDMMEKASYSAVNALKAVNSSDWSNLYDTMLANEKLLFNSMDEWDECKELSESKRSTFIRQLVTELPADTTEDFRNIFADAYDDYEASQKKDKNSGGGGGGGSKGGASAVGMTGSNAPKDTQTILNETKYAFTDTVSHWSSVYVDELLSRGIVSEASDGRFRPDDSITREEFTKLLVLAAGTADTTNTEAGFNDAESGAWYNPFINSAVKLGIITGYGDGSFGIGDLITREDAATVCYRAYGKAEGDALADFTDDAEISDYAKSAVYACRSLGIVGGFEDNSFRPKVHLTRGQAAKIIVMLINAEGGNE